MNPQYQKAKTTSVFINNILDKNFSMEKKFQITNTFNQDFVKDFMKDKEDCINIELENDEPFNYNNAEFFQSIIHKKSNEPYFLLSEMSVREISNLVNAIN